MSSVRPTSPSPPGQPPYFSFTAAQIEKAATSAATRGKRAAEPAASPAPCAVRARIDAPVSPPVSPDEPPDSEAAPPDLCVRDDAVAAEELPVERFLRELLVSWWQPTPERRVVQASRRRGPLKPWSPSVAHK